MISGLVLLEARRRAGLSQAELARRAGKATSVIGRWERGEVDPSLETLRQVICACDLDLMPRLVPRDTEQDATIDAALDLTPTQRLEQLAAWVVFVGEARANLDDPSPSRV